MRALGVELTRRRENVISYDPPKGSAISDSGSEARQLAKHIQPTMTLAKGCSGEVTLRALGVELTRRRENVISYDPPKGSAISDSGSEARQLAKQKWGQSARKLYKFAQYTQRNSEHGDH